MKLIALLLTLVIGCGWLVPLEARTKNKAPHRPTYHAPKARKAPKAPKAKAPKAPKRNLKPRRVKPQRARKPSVKHVKAVPATR